MGNNLNLVTSWNTLWAQLTQWAPGLGTFLSVVGLAIVLISIGKWLWDKRRGGGGTFPTMAVVLGLVLAGPTVVIPVLLSIVQVLFGVVVNIINWVTTTIKP